MWTDREKEILNQHLGKITIKEIACKVNKTERAVRLFMYRQGLSAKNKLECPLIERMLSVKFGSPKYFTPDRAWFDRVGIGQKRFSTLKNGFAQPTEQELKAIAKGINLSVDEMCEFFKERQLELFNQ